MDDQELFEPMESNDENLQEFGTNVERMIDSWGPAPVTVHNLESHTQARSNDSWNTWPEPIGPVWNEDPWFANPVIDSLNPVRDGLGEMYMDVATCQPMTKAARPYRKQVTGSRAKASGSQQNGKELQKMEVLALRVESGESSSETSSSKEPTPEPIQDDADRHLQVDVASARRTDSDESLSNEGPKRRRSLSPPPSRKTRRKTLVDSVGTQPIQQTYNAEASTSASSSQFQFVQESGVSKAPSTARSAKRSVLGKGSNKPTDTFFCNVCKEAGYFASFPRSDNLKRHLLAHKSEENECWCPYCKKGIGLAYNAFEHFNRIHLDHCTHFEHEPA
ncbi:hypothetical protein FS842_006632, partial [Serendipita sp. 407]